MSSDSGDDVTADYFMTNMSVTDDTKLPIEGRAFFILGPDNWLREHIAGMVQTKIFDNIILVLIFVSSVCLAIENPLRDPDSLLSDILEVLDIVLTVLFAIEMVMKMITYGLLFGKHAYLRSAWNFLDCFVVIVSILALIPQVSVSSNLTALRALRTFRALRPLRMISRNPGLKLVVNALISSIPGIVNVALIALLIFLIFSIVGVNYMKGLNGGCSGDCFDALTEEQVDLITYPRLYSNLTAVEKLWGDGSYSDKKSKSICEWMGCEWDEEYHCPQNFNNVFEALSTFFQLITTEGWQDVMYIATDGRGYKYYFLFNFNRIGMQPIPDHQIAWSFFFMAFIVVGAFFVLNLFTGIVIDNFNNMKRKLGKDHVFLTDEQREWVEMQEALLAMKVQRPLKRPNRIYQYYYII